MDVHRRELHAASLVLHGVNSLLLFVLVRQLLRRWSATADHDWISGCAALAAGIWALHPFRAETVGWASGFLYVWATFFVLLALIVYADSGGGGSSKWRVPVAALLNPASKSKFLLIESPRVGGEAGLSAKLKAQPMFAMADEVLRFTTTFRAFGGIDSLPHCSALYRGIDSLPHSLPLAAAVFGATSSRGIDSLPRSSPVYRGIDSLPHSSSLCLPWQMKC